jgi:hypothetical protein
MLSPEGEGDAFRNGVFNGVPIPTDDRKHLPYAQRFSMDLDALPRLADVCRRRGLPPAVVVLFPVTKAYADWHERVAPDAPYAAFRGDLAAACAAAGLRMIDLGDPGADNTLFMDATHLNAAGQAWFTPRLAERLLVQ